MSPEYNKLICNRILKVNEKKEKNIFFNSLMFFVDMRSATQDDFNDFIKLKDIRNKFVHEMQDLIIENVFIAYKEWLDKLIKYIQKLIIIGQKTLS